MRLRSLLKKLLAGLRATPAWGRTAVALTTDHGEALYEHGYGNQMFVLSGNAIGGLHGSWPGLSPGQLVDGTDLAVTTDYRRVLSEILIRRSCNPNLGAIFPGYTGYSPLGIVQGPDLAPIYGEALFSDGFESGNVSAWSASAP